MVFKDLHACLQAALVLPKDPCLSQKLFIAVVLCHLSRALSQGGCLSSLLMLPLQAPQLSLENPATDKEAKIYGPNEFLTILVPNDPSYLGVSNTLALPSPPPPQPCSCLNGYIHFLSSTYAIYSAILGPQSRESYYFI